MIKFKEVGGREGGGELKVLLILFCDLPLYMDIGEMLPEGHETQCGYLAKALDL